MAVKPRVAGVNWDATRPRLAILLLTYLHLALYILVLYWL